MEMLNKAFEDADAFKKMMEKAKGRDTTGEIRENRRQRRARERAEKKAAIRAKKVSA